RADLQPDEPPRSGTGLLRFLPGHHFEDGGEGRRRSPAAHGARDSVRRRRPECRSDPAGPKSAGAHADQSRRIQGIPPRMGAGAHLRDDRRAGSRDRRARTPALHPWQSHLRLAADGSRVESAAALPPFSEARRWRAMRAALVVPAFALLPRLLIAQGVTMAAMQGTGVGDDRSPIAGASVRVSNVSDGRRWEVTTRSNGRYALEDVSIGGPYRIEVRALGFAPEARDGIVLTLGQRVIADFVLQPAQVQLAPVTVTASADPILNPGRTGPAEIVSAARISALPNLGRDLVTLLLLSPQAAISPSTRFAQTEGVTLAGQNRVLNAFQVDGGVNHDLYSGRMQPGLQTWPRPISLEAVEDIQVLVAPFDVRYGGFAGGVLNAVTKSGTNTVHGSVFGSLADAALTGQNATGVPVGDFAVRQFGGSVGGPIVRDRVHYFLSADIYRRIIPDVGPLVTDTAGGADLAHIGISYVSATRFEAVLRNTYGLDPGTLGPYEGRAPAVDVFSKITAQVGTNSHLELSHHYTDGERKTYIARQFGTYYLSSVGQHVPATGNASRVIWTTLIGGGWSSE